jgi:predicted alpha/beta hydrolase
MIHPAIGTPGKYYDRLAKRLVLKNNWAIGVQEMRGHGTSSWIASSTQNWSYWTPVEMDIDLHLSIIKSLFPQNPIFALGHSAGGVIWSLWMAKMAALGRCHDIAGLVSICSGSVYYKIHPKSTQCLMLGMWVWTASSALGWFPGAKLGFGGEREAKHFIQDWTHNIFWGHWQPHRCPISDITTKWFKHIHVPKAFISIDQDQYTPHASTLAFISMFPQGGDHTHFKITAKDDLELSKVDLPQLHHRWAKTDSFIPIISNWINSKLPSGSANTLNGSSSSVEHVSQAIESSGNATFIGNIQTGVSPSLAPSPTSATLALAKL